MKSPLVLKCPGCQKLPVIYFSSIERVFKGGCLSRDSALCVDLSAVVYQTTIDRARDQWNAAVLPIHELLSKKGIL